MAQDIGNSVALALRESLLSEFNNRSNYIYCWCGCSLYLQKRFGKTTFYNRLRKNFRTDWYVQSLEKSRFVTNDLWSFG